MREQDCGHLCCRSAQNEGVIVDGGEVEMLPPRCGAVLSLIALACALAGNAIADGIEAAELLRSRPGYGDRQGQIAELTFSLMRCSSVPKTLTTGT